MGQDGVPKFTVRCPIAICSYKTIRNSEKKANSVAYAHRYQYGEDHLCVVREFKAKPKHVSRSTRYSIAMADWNSSAAW